MCKKVKDLLIIIPAYNEAASIDKVLKKINKQLKDNYLEDKSTILIINDCSTDKTFEIAQKCGAEVISNFSHLGYGGSLQVGYRYALEHDFSKVIQMDADGQHDPSNIIKIYEELNRPCNCYIKPKGGLGKDFNTYYDIVLGSRFLADSVSFEVSNLKKLALNYFRKIFKLATGQNLTDPTTGLQGLSKAVVYYYSKFNQFDCKYPDSNVLIEAAKAGFKISEIPAIMHAREQGASMHSGLKPVYYMMHMTLSVISVSLRRDIVPRYRSARLYSLGITNSLLLS